MKKTIALALFAISLGAQAQQNNAQTDIDSLAYAIGIAQSKGLKTFIENQLDIDFAKFGDSFIKGLDQGAAIEKNTAEEAEEAGKQIGQQVKQMMLPQINKDAFGEDSTKTLPVGILLQGMKDALQAKSTMTTDEAAKYADAKMKDLKRASLLQQYGANKTEGEEFLKKNAKKRGVKKLEGGVQYKVLVAGKGEMPTAESEVKVNYEGRTLDGNVFDSSYKRNEPTTFKVNSVIKGWQTALTHMPVGSTWEVYIPEGQAYGEQNTGEIKPFSMLIFKIELLEIVK